MQANKGNSIAYSALALLLVSGIIACLVALVNGLTAPAIKEHEEAALKQNIEKIFENCGGYEDITAQVGEMSGVTAVYKVKSATGGNDSYCVHASAPGYGGAIEMLVGFDCDGVIAGVAVLSAQGETPGVGQRITEKGFLKGFNGLKYNGSGSTVDGISGATVSSGGALKAVNSACAAMEKIFAIGEESEVAA